MAEFIAVVSLAASIVQLIDASTKVYERVKEYKEGTVLGDVTKQVDLLHETLKRLQTAQTDGFIHATSERAISGVVEGCLTLIKDLDRVISLMTPADGSSRYHRVFKGIQSFGRDRRIQGILAKVDRSSAQLASFFAVDASVFSRETAKLNFNTNTTPAQSTRDAAFFEVPALHVSHFVGREDLLGKIDASFSKSAGTLRVPVTVLLGMGGQGVGTTKSSNCLCHIADVVPGLENTNST